MNASIPSVGSIGEPPRTVLQKRVDSGESTRAILEELYRRHQDGLFAFARKSVSNAADAEDVVANVFLKMQQHFDDMIKRESVDGWIFSVAYPAYPAHSASADFYRHAKKSPADFDQLVRAHLIALTERGRIGRADLASYWDQVMMEVKQTDVAIRRGAGQPRIAKRNAAVSRELRISIYLCYLLGRVRPPYWAAAIREHLDIFDLDPGPLKDGDRELLRRAGGAVTAGQDGDVVLRPKDAKAAIEDPETGPVAGLDELHDAESVYVVAIGNPAPRCIASPCSRHKTSGGTGGATR